MSHGETSTSKTKFFPKFYDRFCFFAKFYVIISLMTPSKSMPQMKTNDFKKIYPYVWLGTLEPRRIEDILTKTQIFCCLPGASVLKYKCIVKLKLVPPWWALHLFLLRSQSCTWTAEQSGKCLKQQQQ